MTKKAHSWLLWFRVAQSSGKSLKETLSDALSKSNFYTAQFRFPFLCCCHTLVHSSAYRKCFIESDYRKCFSCSFFILVFLCKMKTHGSKRLLGRPDHAVTLQMCFFLLDEHQIKDGLYCSLSVFNSEMVNSYDQAPVHSAASKIGCIFCQIHWSEPFHHPVVGPLHHVRRRDAVLLEGPQKVMTPQPALSVHSSYLSSDKNSLPPLPPLVLPWLRDCFSSSPFQAVSDEMADLV